jgi:hypothetical protein
MKLIEKLVKYALKRPYSHIGSYMERYWIIPYNRFTPAVRIHYIKESDDSRVFHDHPWWYITIILKGGYTEVKPIFDDLGNLIGEQRRRFNAGSILFRRAKSWHRLEIEPNDNTWTLFITGKWQQRWGFLIHSQKKMYYKEYLGKSE